MPRPREKSKDALVAAREPVDRLQRLPKEVIDGISQGMIDQRHPGEKALLLQLARADVLHQGREVRGLAVGTANTLRRHARPNRRPVRPQISLLQREPVGLACQNAVEEGHIGRQIVRMGDVRPAHLKELFAGPTHQLAHPVIDRQPPAAGRAQRGSQQREVEECAETRVARPPGARKVARQTAPTDVSPCHDEEGDGQQQSHHKHRFGCGAPVSRRGLAGGEAPRAAQNVQTLNLLRARFVLPCVALELERLGARIGGGEHPQGQVRVDGPPGPLDQITQRDRAEDEPVECRAPRLRRVHRRATTVDGEEQERVSAVPFRVSGRRRPGHQRRFAGVAGVLRSGQTDRIGEQIHPNRRERRAVHGLQEDDRRARRRRLV